MSSCFEHVAIAILQSQMRISSSHTLSRGVNRCPTYLTDIRTRDASNHIPLSMSFSLRVSAEISCATASRDLRAKPSKAGLPGSQAESKWVMALPWAAKSHTVCVRSNMKVFETEAVFSGVIRSSSLSPGRVRRKGHFWLDRVQGAHFPFLPAMTQHSLMLRLALRQLGQRCEPSSNWASGCDKIAFANYG
jgi:hypothetical protein